MRTNHHNQNGPTLGNVGNVGTNVGSAKSSFLVALSLNHLLRTIHLNSSDV